MRYGESEDSMPHWLIHYEVWVELTVSALGMGQDWPRPINIFLSLWLNSGNGLNLGLRQSADSPSFTVVIGENC